MSEFLIQSKLVSFWRLSGLVFYLETIRRLLNHDLMASIWQKTISILAGNFNSGHYFFTAIPLLEAQTPILSSISLLAPQGGSELKSFQPHCGYRRYVVAKFITNSIQSSGGKSRSWTWYHPHSIPYSLSFCLNL